MLDFIVIINYKVSTKAMVGYLLSNYIKMDLHTIK